MQTWPKTNINKRQTSLGSNEEIFPLDQPCLKCLCHCSPTSSSFLYLASHTHTYIYANQLPYISSFITLLNLYNIYIYIYTHKIQLQNTPAQSKVSITNIDGIMRRSFISFPSICHTPRPIIGILNPLLSACYFHFSIYKPFIPFYISQYRLARSGKM